VPVTLLTVPSRANGGLLLGAWLVLTLALAACTAGIGGKNGDPGDEADAGGDPNALGADCSAVLGPRMVRLNYGQYASTLSALLTPAALTNVELPPARERAFQALFEEGDQIDTAILRKTFDMAEAAVTTLSDPSLFASITGCAAPTDESCIKGFLPAFAERAYRRPLTAEESVAIVALYDEVKSGGSSVEDAARSAMLGVLIAPPTLYRTEFGAAGPLDDYERASEISYFLGNAPPDQALSDAVASGAFATSEGARTEVQRLLAEPAVQQNLEEILLAYYKVAEIDESIKDPTLFPEFTLGLRNSMYTETQMFIAATLRGGTPDDLLTSRTTYIDENLASLYGVTYPAAAGSGFVAFEFPAGERAGLLTQASVLARRAVTDETSVVSRGLYVNSNVLCLQTPPLPPASASAQVDAQKADRSLNQREKSEVRLMTDPCGNCHSAFDPYGLVLESYDAIGRFRTGYPDGKPIDTSAVLPEAAGGGSIQNASELMHSATASGLFSRCLTTNLVKYALAAQTSVEPDDCAVKEVMDAFAQTDQSLLGLFESIALSKTLSERSGEVTP
jgi:hypothetical protein